VCDGTADEVQINAAIQALPTQGGLIRLLSGTYIIAAAIVLNRNNCVIQGSGLDNTIILAANNANCNGIEYTGTGEIIFCALKEFTLVGNRENNTTGYGVYFAPTGAGHFWDFLARDIWTKSWSNDGFYSYDGHGFVLDHVISEYNDGNGITFPDGGIDEVEIRNGTIKFNLIGIKVGANNSKVVENEVTDNSSYGIELSGIGCQAIANSVSANTLSGIHITTQANIQAVHNIVTANKQHGILCDTSGALILGNSLKGNGTQTTNTYDEISVAHHNSRVISNIIDCNSSSKYGINFSASWSSGNVSIANAINSPGTAATNDLATGTSWIVGGKGTTVIPETTTYGGNVGIGTTSPTAYLHLNSGTATAGTAPIKLTSGVVNTTPEIGTIEFDGTDFYISI